MIAFAAALRSVMPGGERLVIKVFACLAAAGLVVSWLLVSTLGENNDLGLRAILLAEVVLIVMTAAGMAGLHKRGFYVRPSWRPRSAGWRLACRTSS